MKPEELLTAWQKRLRMEDWTIKLETDCAPEDFRLDSVCGECEYQEVNKSAVVRILDPKFYGDRILPFDYERILVHELLHAKFALLENSENELQNRLVHQLIEELARAFTEKEGKEK